MKLDKGKEKENRKVKVAILCDRIILQKSRGKSSFFRERPYSLPMAAIWRKRIKA